ncbi:hypothetical protein JQS43_16820 [Natronosporangium hydrolyticum]|uniref:SPOR domain-containing protein n=1 Tax=Natronosporangium hydrolyticum TaxID=2811111 RepID=A0A895YCV6_9ACTN|nr:hypothetical protein [Natronosporangium hydrolyticum]QSB13283.1 hypothetical protein JQS43_16820 [Natronosporangium hydrolyticum]
MSSNGYYWCTKHNRVEWGDSMCRAKHRLGPFDTPNEAERALERVQERNEAWDDQDEDWGQPDAKPAGR